MNTDIFTEDSVPDLLHIALDILLVFDILGFIICILLALVSTTREPIMERRALHYIFAVSGTIMFVVYVATFNNLTSDWTRLFFRSATLVNYATVSSFFWLEWRRAGR